jgi:hypothetical protein
MSMTLAGLPELDPGEAHLRQVLPAALSGRRAAGAVIRAAVPRALPDRLIWYHCTSGWAFAPDRVAGVATLAPRNDGPAAAGMLAAIEPLLDQIELALGVALEPEGLADAPPANPLITRVETLAGGVTRDRLWIALPPGAAVLPAPMEFAPELLATVPLAARITLDGPRVPPVDAAAIGAGDLLLLGAGPLAATLSVAGQLAIAGRYDPARGFIPS